MRDTCTSLLSYTHTAGIPPCFGIFPFLPPPLPATATRLLLHFIFHLKLPHHDDPPSEQSVLQEKSGLGRNLEFSPVLLQLFRLLLSLIFNR